MRQGVYRYKEPSLRSVIKCLPTLDVYWRKNKKHIQKETFFTIFTNNTCVCLAENTFSIKRFP